MISVCCAHVCVCLWKYVRVFLVSSFVQHTVRFRVCVRFPNWKLFSVLCIQVYFSGRNFFRGYLSRLISRVKREIFTRNKWEDAEFFMFHGRDFYKHIILLLFKFRDFREAV